MALQRDQIARGPGVVTWDGLTIFGKENIEADLELTTFEVPSSMHGGNADVAADSVLARVRMTPVGEYDATVIAKLWPYGSYLPGQSIFGATDKPLEIHTLAGQQITFQTAALTQMPEVSLSAGKTIIGPIEWLCLGKYNTDRTAAESLLAVAAAVFADLDWATFDIDKVIKQPYGVAWGASAPFSALKTIDGGTTISFNLTTAEVRTDDLGLTDLTFDSLGVMARLTPANVSEAQLLAAFANLQGTNALQRGASLRTNANDLVVTGTGVVATVKKAAMKTAGYRFGRTTLRQGEIGFEAIRTFGTTTGKSDPLFTLATA